MQLGGQTKRKLVRTGIVGALLGVLFALGGFIVESEHVNLVTGRREQLPSAVHVWHAVATILATTVIFVLLLGVLPLALEQLFAWLKGRPSGRA